jgi:tRNA G18 (ribose-2'-O)-methylase SpoU
MQNINFIRKDLEEERSARFFSEDCKWSDWTRNVVDEYKSLSNEQIVQKLKENSLPFAVMMSHLEGDLNFGTVVRSANAFGAREVFYYGTKHWNRKGALGSYHYTSVKHLKSIDEIKQLKERYFFVGIEQNKSSVELYQFQWPKDKEILIILGEESKGLTEDVIELCDALVEIKQRGSIRSLNAGVASSIVMNDFANKYTSS